jgi:hypothetical protein
MAGTLPHAVFVETDADGEGGCAAYAAELPGCSSFAPTDEEAARAIPTRVVEFMRWLREKGEAAPALLGDNWYEVERAPAREGGRVRAAFSLDELAPSAEEWATWLRWMELAREELADAMDATNGGGEPALERIAMQDDALADDLGAAPAAHPDDLVDRLYAARDRLTAALVTAGRDGERVRRAIRLAIADDLHAAEQLRGADR